MQDQRLEINEQPIELYESDPIGLTLRGNTLSKVGQIQAGFSNRFKVPRNRNNRLALNNAEQINQQDTGGLPYISLPARYFQNGVPILQRGSCILEESTEKDYILSVYGNNFGILNITSEKTLQDIDYSAIDHLATLAAIQAGQWYNNTQADGFVYALIDWGATSKTSDNIPLRAFPPVLFVRWLFDQIFTGYTVQGDLYSDTLFNSLVLDLREWVAEFLIRETNDEFTVNLIGVPTNPFADVPYNTPGDILLDTTSGWGTVTVDGITTSFWAVPADGAYIVEYEIDYSYNTSGSVRPFLFFGFDSVAFAFDQVPLDVNTRTTIRGEITVNRLSGQRIEFKVGRTTDTFFNFIVYSNKLSIRKADTPDGGKTNFAKSVHPLSQSEFIQGIFQMFGVTPAFDEVTQILTLNYLENRINDYSTAKDWSNKIDFSRAFKIESRISGFNQVNACNYVSEDTDEFNASFSITDTTIGQAGTFISLPFAASKSDVFTTNELLLPIAKKYTLNDDSPAKYVQTETLSPRVFYVREVTPGGTAYVLQGDTGGTLTINVAYRQGVFVDAEQVRNLGFSGPGNLLAAQYQTLTDSVLLAPRVVTAYFKLTQVDVYDLDLPELVFLDVMTEDIQLQGIFYINKIENYVSGYPAKVELIKVA